MHCLICAPATQLAAPQDQAIQLLRSKPMHAMQQVYRRDQPQLAKGRYREFTQCDFDLAGKYVSMGAEAEVLQVGSAGCDTVSAAILTALCVHSGQKTVLHLLELSRALLARPFFKHFSVCGSCGRHRLHACCKPCMLHSLSRLITTASLQIAANYASPGAS